MAFAGMAQATPVTVRITGSSAYRGAVMNAIAHLLTTPTGAYVGSSLGGANQSIVTGTLTNAAGGFPAGTTVFFKCSWSGSVAGLIVGTTGANTAAQFLATSNTMTTVTPGTGVDVNHGVTGGNSLSSPVLDAAQTADVVFSDVFQSSTSFKSPALTPAVTGGTAPSGVVGVVPFVWVANNPGGLVSSNSITNVNSQQANQLLAGGLALAQFTGVDSDNATLILPVGRNADSGTRFTTFAETGFNVVGATAVQPQQYAVTQSGGVVSHIDLYPAETLFGVSYTAGQSGYGSGGNVATAMTATGSNDQTNVNNSNPAILLTYLGENDAKTVVTATNAGHFLSYNGIVYGSVSGGVASYNRTLIDEGVYTLWGYEHVYYPSGNANAAIANALAAQVKGTDAPISGEKISNMNVSRGVEGGPIAYTGPQS